MPQELDRDPPLLERSPGTKWRQKWNKNEVPTSHTPTRSNTPTTMMQVNGIPNTSMLVLWWGNGLKSTTKYNRSSSPPNLTALGKGSRKKTPSVLIIRLVNNSTAGEARPWESASAALRADSAGRGPGRARSRPPAWNPLAKPELHLWLISPSCHQSSNCALLGKITNLATWHMTFVTLSYLKSDVRLHK